MVVDGRVVELGHMMPESSGNVGQALDWGIVGMALMLEEVDVGGVSSLDVISEWAMTRLLWHCREALREAEGRAGLVSMLHFLLLSRLWMICSLATLWREMIV